MRVWSKIFSLLIFALLLGAGLFFGGSFLAKSKTIEITPLTAQVSETLPQTPLPEEKEKPVTLILTGDIMLNRRVEMMIRQNNDWRFPFLKISDYLKQADILFGNLENPVSDKGTKVGSIYSFRADPRAIEGLTYAGFDVVSLANNHAFDYAKEALEDTFLRLKEAGIDYVGAGFNDQEAFAPVIKEVRGLKIGFLAYTDLGSRYWTAAKNSSGLAWLNHQKIKSVAEDIKNVKSQVDVLIVSLHSGDEYTQNLTAFQTDFAKAALEAGADIIAGHHPHVVQKSEIYPATLSGHPGWIFYSLGNFVFDQSFSKETMEGQVVKITIENNLPASRHGKIKEVLPQKIIINSEFQPEIER